MTTEHPPSRLSRCELCGGTQIGNLNVVSQYPVGVHPEGRQMWAKPLSPLNAVLCLECGHTKLFASDLTRIQNTAAKHPERFTW